MYLTWNKTKKCKQTLESAQYGLEIIFKTKNKISGSNIYIVFQNYLVVIWVIVTFKE